MPSRTLRQGPRPRSFYRTLDHSPQICRWLDRSEKHNNFALALRLLVSDTEPADTPDDDEEDADNASYSDGLAPMPSPPNFFLQAVQLAAGVSPSTSLPLQIFCTDTTGFHLNQLPNLPSLTVDEVAIKFKLPDLRAALSDYVRRMQELRSPIFTIGQRRLSPVHAALPFSRLRVWYSTRVQVRSMDSANMNTPHRICAEPCSPEWPFGRYGTVVIADGSEPG